MKIKKKKIFKSKHLFFAHFSMKTGDFLYRWENTNILPQIFFQVKKVIFFVILAKKRKGLVR